MGPPHPTHDATVLGLNSKFELEACADYLLTTCGMVLVRIKWKIHAFTCVLSH